MSNTTELYGDSMIDPVTGETIDEKELAERLLAQAKAQGVSLVGPGGLLAGLTKTVLETALEAELTEHLGHEHGQTPVGSNVRNGTRPKTVLTQIGPVQIEVPRDRDGSFDPVIVPKRVRRLDGIDEIVLSLSARGLTTGEIAAHFDEVYGASVSKDTVSRITEKVAGRWPSGPPGLWIRSIRCCSWTLSTSRSATGRCGTCRSLRCRYVAWRARYACHHPGASGMAQCLSADGWPT